MAKRTVRRRSRRFGRRRRAGSKSMSIADTAAGLLGIAIMAKPYAEGSTASAIRSGNVGAIPGAFISDSQNALTPQNIFAAATPILVVGLTKWGLRAAGIRSKRFGRVRAF